MGKTPTAPPMVHVPGGGRLALAGAPGARSVPLWLSTADVVVTLLTADEMRGRGLAFSATPPSSPDAGGRGRWLHRPIGGASFADAADVAALRDAGEAIAHGLAAGAAVAVHCSAGLHRTGAAAYVALRLRHLPHDAAVACIAAARVTTAEELLRKASLLPAAAAALQLVTARDVMAGDDVDGRS